MCLLESFIESGPLLTFLLRNTFFSLPCYTGRRHHVIAVVWDRSVQWPRMYGCLALHFGLANDDVVFLHKLEA